MAFGTGLVALDVVQSGESSETARAWAGGTCGNVLTVLAYLGWEAYPVSTLGIDEASSLVLDDMRRFGVNIDLIRFSEARKPLESGFRSVVGGARCPLVQGVDP